MAGKGGSGKTTIAGTLARALAQSDHRVLAIDGDSNPNLATTIGIAGDVPPLPRDILVDVVDENGERRRKLGVPPREILERYSAQGPDGIRFVIGGRVGHAGVGCMCGAHARVRNLLGELVGSDWSGSEIVVDLEAGLENFSRGTPRHVDAVVAVVEPYFRSMETARRVCELARELEVGGVYAVGNRIRSERDDRAIRDFCEGHQLQLIATVPYDEALLEAEREGAPPIDYGPSSPAVSAIRELARRITQAARPS